LYGTVSGKFVIRLRKTGASAPPPGFGIKVGASNINVNAGGSGIEAGAFCIARLNTKLLKYH